MLFSIFYRGPSWSWLYCIWINNLPMLSLPITTEVNLNPSHGELYSLCDKVCQWLAASLWFSPGTTVSSTNKTDRHDISEILLKVALNTITSPLFFIPHAGLECGRSMVLALIWSNQRLSNWYLLLLCLVVLSIQE